jgi:hypothetical protein
MKIVPMMRALWICSLLAAQAAVAARSPPERAPAERGPAERGPAERAPAKSSGVSPATHAQSHGPAQRSPVQRAAPKGASSIAIVPPHPAAKLPSRPGAGPSAEATGTVVSRTPGVQGMSPASPSRLALTKIPARAPQGAKVPTRAALIGAPHPGASGRLGGPATGRGATANRAALDGAQMRRRF